MLAIKDPRKIERIALTHTDDVEAELRASVLTEAHKEFGYQADSFATTGPLAKTLAQLEIQPLNTAQVEIYKKSKEETTHTHRRFWVGWAVAIIPPALFISLLVEAPRLVSKGWVDDLQITCVILTVIFAVIGNAFYHVEVSDEIVDRRTVRGWEIYNLGVSDRSFNRYPRYIPVHVLNEAVQIKRAIPDCTFRVQELTSTTQDIPNPMPDPFLVVSLGSEKYYIAVWDEREFEAKM